MIPQIYYEENVKPLLYLIKLFQKNKLPNQMIHNIFMYIFHRNDKVIVFIDTKCNKLNIFPNYYWLSDCLMNKYYEYKTMKITIWDHNRNRKHACWYAEYYTHIQIDDNTHYFVKSLTDYIYYQVDNVYYKEITNEKNEKKIEKKILPELFEFFIKADNDKFPHDEFYFDAYDKRRKRIFFGTNEPTYEEIINRRNNGRVYKYCDGDLTKLSTNYSICDDSCYNEFLMFFKI